MTVPVTFFLVASLKPEKHSSLAEVCIPNRNKHTLRAVYTTDIKIAELNCIEVISYEEDNC